MANGICVYAESYNGELETVAAELVSAAKGLSERNRLKTPHRHKTPHGSGRNESRQFFPA